jgi:hypothetical protein
MPLLLGKMNTLFRRYTVEWSCLHNSLEIGKHNFRSLDVSNLQADLFAIFRENGYFDQQFQDKWKLFFNNSLETIKTVKITNLAFFCL